MTAITDGSSAPYTQHIGGTLPPCSGGSVPRPCENSDTAFCLEALEEALSRYGKPAIFNTDQGSQFTSTAFTDILREQKIRISMDGKGSWRDNVFVERLWRSIKYEEVYLKAYASVSEAKASLKTYIDFYNATRPHSRLDKMTPDEFYYETLPALPRVA